MKQRTSRCSPAICSDTIVSCVDRGTAAVITMGCRVNRVEIDTIASQLIASGIPIVSAENADVVIVNTCAVTAEAEAKTRKALRRALKLSQAPSVIATGCAATLFASELKQLDARIVVEADKSKVCARVRELLTERCSLHQSGASSDVASHTAPVASHAAPVTSPSFCGTEAPITSTGRARPGIKVQDGCDNRCTYCIVWKARGPSRSRNLPEIIAEVNAAVALGAGEVVFTGINLGRYVAEHAGKTVRLPELIDAVLQHTDVGRVRLSSIEPPECDTQLLSVMADAKERVAPFLHIPLQSGCDATLLRMGRLYDTSQYARIADQARAMLPHAALACDVIVGFPGESEKEFDESIAFCERMAFSRMHVFRYSKRPGTPAANATNQVDSGVRSERARKMRSLAAHMRKNYIASCVGRQQLVSVSGDGTGLTGGSVEVLLPDTARTPGLLITTTPHHVTGTGLLDARMGECKVVRQK